MLGRIATTPDPLLHLLLRITEGLRRILTDWESVVVVEVRKEKKTVF